MFCDGSVLPVLFTGHDGGSAKRDKGIWWMPWHVEAMKDVARCDKLWGGVSTL